MASVFDDGTVVPYIAAIKPYQPGKPIEEVRRELGLSRIVKIASNENPLGPAPKARAAIEAACEGLHFYPDAGAYAIRQALSNFHDVPADEISLGAGSNELIGLLISAFCQGGRDNIVVPAYSFISYKLQAMAQNVGVVEAPTRADLSCDVDAVLAAVNDKTKVVIVAHPNNPTGQRLCPEELSKLVRELPPRIVLLVDEAYYEYATYMHADYGSAMALRDQRQRLMVTRTFSKAYGLASLRIGYGFASADILDAVFRARRPFHVNGVAQVAAIAALDDTDFLQQSRELNKKTIKALTELLEGLDVDVVPSATNFVLARFGDRAARVHERLLHNGVIVRPMAAWGLPDFLRISAYHPDDAQFVAEAMRKAVA